MTTIKQQTDFGEAPIEGVTPGDLVEIVLRAGKKNLARTKEVSATVFEVVDEKEDLDGIDRIAGYYAGWYRRKDGKPGVHIQPTLMEWTSHPATYIHVPVEAVASCQVLKKSEKNNGEDCDRIGWWTPAFP